MTKACVPVVLDPVDAAKAAGLRYTNDRQSGYRRVSRGDSVRYLTADGKVLRDTEALARIRSLVIPPAWRDVWITPHANGHLQCTGRDARGRKQSRYHPKWRQVRDETKYERMLLFAEALPVIRCRVARDMANDGLPREKVIATVVRVMEETHIRVGNEEYARTNKSYGLTTMRTKHVDVRGAKVTFDFQGKSRVHHTINLQDRRLAKIIRQISELPGYELFQYLDEAGKTHSINSSDVNDYLRETTGEHFTAKDFRTWAGSVLCCDLLQELDSPASITEAKKHVVDAIKQVAERLGNTPSVCRKCYVHPAVLESYLNAVEAPASKSRRAFTASHALHADERRLVELLTRMALPKAA